MNDNELNHGEKQVSQLLNKFIEMTEIQKQKLVVDIDYIATGLLTMKLLLNKVNAGEGSLGHSELIEEIEDNLDRLREMYKENDFQELTHLSIILSLKENSLFHSEKWVVPILVKDKTTGNRVNDLETYQKANLYRIYDACQLRLMDNKEIDSLEITITDFNSKICFDFIVKKIDSSEDKKIISTENRIFIESIKARVLVLAGKICVETNWIDRIKLEIPLPGVLKGIFLN